MYKCRTHGNAVDHATTTYWRRRLGEVDRDAGTELTSFPQRVIPVIAVGTACPSEDDDDRVAQLVSTPIDDFLASVLEVGAGFRLAAAKRDVPIRTGRRAWP